MESYNFIKYKKAWWELLQESYSLLYTEIFPIAAGFALLYLGISACIEEGFSFKVVFFALIGIIILLVKMRRIKMFFYQIFGPKITLITIGEDAISLEYNKKPYKIRAAWENIARIKYHTNVVDEGINSTVEYPDYTEFFGVFSDINNIKFRHVLRLANDDWWNEQEETILGVLMKFEKSKNKLEIL